jgi:hypothetical protein
VTDTKAEPLDLADRRHLFAQLGPIIANIGFARRARFMRVSQAVASIDQHQLAIHLEHERM